MIIELSKRIYFTPASVDAGTTEKRSDTEHNKK
jgi:hypothetical protein